MFDKVYLIKSISAVTNYNSSSCFQYGGLSDTDTDRSKWLLDLPVFWTFSMGKNNFLPLCLFLLKYDFCQNAYFCLKMIFGPCYFIFFFKTGGWVENSILFYFLFLTPSLILKIGI